VKKQSFRWLLKTKIISVAIASFIHDIYRAFEDMNVKERVLVILTKINNLQGNDEWILF
jgi:hypothetical protein